ncbi:hypothetical protein G3I28_37765, partial [Streptomyces sp. SID10116]|nr:hypothetical protein [Streptomyces sp. SID10116]
MITLVRRRATLCALGTLTAALAALAGCAGETSGGVGRPAHPPASA